MHRAARRACSAYPSVEALWPVSAQQRQRMTQRRLHPLVRSSARPAPTHALQERMGCAATSRRLGPGTHCRDGKRQLCSVPCAWGSILSESASSSMLFESASPLYFPHPLLYCCTAVLRALRPCPRALPLEDIFGMVPGTSGSWAHVSAPVSCAFGAWVISRVHIDDM